MVLYEMRFRFLAAVGFTALSVFFVDVSYACSQGKYSEVDYGTLPQNQVSALSQPGFEGELPLKHLSQLANLIVYGKIENVDHLLSRSPKIIEQSGSDSLILAASFGKVGIVRVLLEAGVSPDLISATGASALTVASEAGEVEVIKELFRFGADVNLHSDQGPSALVMSIMNGHSDVSELLLELGHKIGSNERRAMDWCSRNN